LRPPVLSFEGTLESELGGRRHDGRLSSTRT
jgi:hypothetical protein